MLQIRSKDITGRNYRSLIELAFKNVISLLLLKDEI